MAFLTKAQAEHQAERLAYHIRKYGVKVVIDLRTGAGGRHWGVDTFHGAMAHHIVSRRSQGLTPFYSLVRNGRSDVPGPLCNIYGGWDRVARIVTMGLANHSGKGGPWVVSGLRIPRDNGRYYFLGTEFEGGLRAADWDDDYRAFMGAVNAGKLDYIRELRGPSITVNDTALCEHSDWARPKGRKIDRLGYTQAKGIAEMQAARRATNKKPTPERTWFDMATKNDLRAVVREEIDNRTGRAVWSFKNENLESGDAYQILRDTRNHARRDFARELLSTELQGMSVEWWLRNGLVLNPDHRQYPADPGSLADLIMQLAEQATGEPVVPYDGTQQREPNEETL